MRLEDYLVELKNCPDEELRDRLGIEDNWPIFLHADYNKVIDHFMKDTMFDFYEKIEELYSKHPSSFQSIPLTYSFDYKPGTVKMQVINKIMLNSTTGMGFGTKDVYKIESERQLRDYNMTIMLHPYQEKKIQGITQLRAIAIVIDDISQYILQEKIPACMPRTIYNDFDKNADFSRIVYHQPK